MVPSENVELAPDVFQLPETVQAPVVTVSVPLVPPVIVTLLTATVEAFAVRIPALPTTSAAVLRPRFAVASSVVLEVSLTVSVPPQRSALVAMVKVCAEPDEEVKVTLLNSDSDRLVPANVIVPPVDRSNRTVAVPASQTVVSVEEFDHVPEMVQLSDPNVMADEEEEILTSPVMMTVPDVEVRSPPDIVALPFTVRALVPFASVPPEMVSAVAVSWLCAVRVPPEIVRPPKVWLAPILTLPVPENVLEVDELVVNVPAEDVSHEPVDIVVVALASSTVFAPEVVKLLAPKVNVPALVAVKVPEIVKLAEKVVEMDELMVKLFAVSSMFMVPPEVSTTTVDVPVVYVPPELSQDVTVIVLPLAVSVPPEPTDIVAALMARLEPLVVKAVVDAPSVIDIVPPTRNVRVACVQV